MNIDEVWMTLNKISTFLVAALVFIFVAQTVGAQKKNGTDDNGTGLEPFPTEWAETFGEVEPDPKPDKLTRNSHYWVSDEKRHDLFREAIADKGGVFIGLGTDQNYLMAAWAKPEVLIPLDFDQMVVYLHYAFRVAFLNAKTPKQFIELIGLLVIRPAVVVIWSGDHAAKIWRNP